jgi:hypothetical protein
MMHRGNQAYKQLPAADEEPNLDHGDVWRFKPSVGNLGTIYDLRAILLMSGLGILADTCIHSVQCLDGSGLDAANKPDNITYLSRCVVWNG